MQDYELDAYLGDTKLPVERREDLLRAAEIIETRYRDDDGDAREVAFTAAVQTILGDETVWDLADGWRSARLAERAAMMALTGSLAVASVSTSENMLAEMTGLNRRTVRKALGK